MAQILSYHYVEIMIVDMVSTAVIINDMILVILLIVFILRVRRELICTDFFGLEIVEFHRSLFCFFQKGIIFDAVLNTQTYLSKSTRYKINKFLRSFIYSTPELYAGVVNNNNPFQYEIKSKQ